MDAMQCLIKTKTLSNSEVLQNCFGNIQKCNLNKYKKRSMNVNGVKLVSDVLQRRVASTADCEAQDSPPLDA